MTASLTIAVSPCPNDTYIFGALALGLLSPVGGERLAFIRRDVEELNAMAASPSGKADVIKISAAMALRLGEDFTILASGAAFGFGAGPKLAVAKGRSQPVRRLAVPGRRTTAALLLSAAIEKGALSGLVADRPHIVPVRYDLIAQSVREGRFDAGLLIHETALAVDGLGLEVVFDVGSFWTGVAGDVPLPLGVIVARNRLGDGLIRALDAKIRESLVFARSSPEAVMPLVRALAQEIEENVIAAHIGAYVGDMSLNMGAAGKTALAALSRLAGVTAARIGA